LSFLGFPSPSQAADVGSLLVGKIQKANLGCKDAKVDSSKVLYAPKRIICTVKGEKTNIEVYSQLNFKKASKYLCDSGFDVPMLTDKKSWSINPDTNATMIAIQKAVGGYVVTTCSIK
jgi:hypothetical protein